MVNEDSDDDKKSRKQLLTELTELRCRMEELEKAIHIHITGKTPNIPTHKRIENALRIKNAAIESSPSAIAMLDLEGNLTYANKAGLKMWGYEKEEEVLGKPAVEFWHEREKASEVMAVLRKKGHWIGEMMAKKKNGDPLSTELTANMVTDPSGIPLCMMASFVDITQKRKMQESLTRKENIYRALFDHMTSGVAVYEAVENGTDFVFRDFNRAGEYIENIKKETLIGRRVKEAFPGVENLGLFKIFQRVWKTGKPEFHPANPYEDQRLGHTWRENYVYKLPSGEIVAVYNDVTERVEAEKKIKGSLEEKKILLREIHHRVKNNMAVISSMLNLQADTFTAPAVVHAFQDSRDRIRSMALIHEKLYRADDLSRVDFSDYIRDLANRIFRSSELHDTKTTMTVEVGNVLLGIDIAIPCGLMVNELLSNAFKYAFPGDRKGTIRIEMLLIEDSESPVYKMIIGDNGIGLPEPVDIKNPLTFGLNLVDLLVRQLDGHIEVDRNNGTTFTITFPAT